MIGLFGGSFDPIHYGHLNLALEMLEFHHLEEVWFIPARVSPHKLDKPPISDQHRLKMLQIALEDQPSFKMRDLEVKRSGPSYTVDTIRELMLRFPEKKFALILGDDTLKHFLWWSEPEEITRLIPLLIGKRNEASLPEEWKSMPWLVQAVQRGLTPTRCFEVSSTELRERLAKRLFCGYLMPQKIIDYIVENNLYLTS